MHITGILFDLDGTLIDSIPAHKKVIRGVAKRHGIRITDEAFARYNGMSTKKGFRKIMHEHHIYLGAFRILLELLKAKKGIINRIKPYKATTKTLERLHKEYAMAVATSSNKRYLKECLQRFGLQQQFQALISADDVHHTKPSPEIFIKAAKAIGKEPEECVVIEDSLNGVIAAKRARMAVIAVLTTTNKALFVGEAEPDLLITDLSKLTSAAIAQANKKAYKRRRPVKQT